MSKIGMHGLAIKFPKYMSMLEELEAKLAEVRKAIANTKPVKECIKAVSTAVQTKIKKANAVQAAITKAMEAISTKEAGIRDLPSEVCVGEIRTLKEAGIAVTNVDKKTQLMFEFPAKLDLADGLYCVSVVVKGKGFDQPTEVDLQYRLSTTMVVNE